MRFEVLPWSGRNSFLARSMGAKALQELLEPAAALGERRYLIAHSHGGNIAYEGLMGAFDSQSEGSTVHGCITLSTPFLSVVAPDDDQARLAPQIYLALGTTWVIVVLVQAYLWGVPEAAPFSCWARWSLVVIAMIAFYLFWLRLAGYRQGFLRREWRIQYFETVPFFAIRAAGDEAAYPLAIGELLARGSHCWQRMAPLLAPVVVLITAVALVWQLGLGVPAPVGSWPWIIGVCAFALFSAPMLVLGACLVTAFGPEVLGALGVFDVSTDVVPPGKTRDLLVLPAQGHPWQIASLHATRHSTPEREDAQDAVIDWIREREGLN